MIKLFLKIKLLPSIISFICFFLPIKTFSASDLSILSLNLHGYHPMGESSRYLQKGKDRKFSKSLSHLYYFTPQELTRGNEQRLDLLTTELKEIKADIILLQEVGGGDWNKPSKNCNDFTKKFAKDSPYENTALRMQRRMTEYTPHLACRGNVGWITNQRTFDDVTVYNKHKKIIFKKGDNPYPHGILVEGMGILTSKNIKVLDHYFWNFPFNYKGQLLFTQIIRFQKVNSKNKKWYLLFNVHMGHKINHIEQSFSIQHAALNYINNHSDRDNFGGLLVGGDFNAMLYRKGHYIDSSMTSWEIKVDGQFDFSTPSSHEGLKDLYHKLNNLKFYKHWASIKNQYEADTRITHIIESFNNLKERQSAYGIFPMQSSLDYIERKYKTCSPKKKYRGFCGLKNRIDFIFATKNIIPKRSFMIFKENSWTKLNNYSDHPGILSTFQL